MFDANVKGNGCCFQKLVTCSDRKSKAIKSEHSNYKTVYETEEELIRWYDREDHKLLMFAPMITASVIRALLK